MKIISWNVNGLRSVIRQGFWDFVEKEKPDLLAIQEIKTAASLMATAAAPPLPLGNYGLYYHSAQKPGYSGVAVYALLKPLGVEERLGEKRFDQEGRLLKLDFGNFSLVNVYLPNGKRDQADVPYKLQAYRLLAKRVGEWRRQKPVVIVGDFNVARAEIDLARPQQNKKNTMFTLGEREALANLLAQDLFDSFRFLHPGEQSFSWWPYWRHCRQRNIGWRIDYVLIDKRLRPQLQNASIFSQYSGSDHCPVGVELLG